MLSYENLEGFLSFVQVIEFFFSVAFSSFNQKIIKLIQNFSIYFINMNFIFVFQIIIFEITKTNNKSKEEEEEEQKSSNKIK